MGARNFAAAHVFSTDIADIESEIRTYVSEIEAAEVDIARKAIEIGKRLQFVKENDLVHGQWEPWLRSVGIVPQTARKYIQVYEQFGNRPTPSGLTIAKLFELLTLPSDIKREDFVAATHTTPEGDKTVDAMTVRELRGVVRAVRDQAGLTKAPQVRKKAEGNPFESIALTDERKGFLYDLPVSCALKVIGEDSALIDGLIDVSSEVSAVLFAEHYDEIKAELSAGRSATTIARQFRAAPDKTPLSGPIVNPYEILDVWIGDSERVVRDKYRDLTRKLHPDTGGSELLFKVVQFAWDLYKRRGY